MAAITWYATNNLVSVHQEMSTTDPGTEANASPQTGWVVGTGATLHSPFDAQSNQASTTFTATTDPDGTPNTGAGAGDCLRSTLPLTGSFASANWQVHFCVRGVTQAGTQDGRIRFRLLRGANADGSGATDISGSQQQGSLVTNLLTSATQDSTLTFNPGAINVANEYIFVQLAWERTGAGGMTTTDVAMRIGNASGNGTRVISADFTPTIPAAIDRKVEYRNLPNAHFAPFPVALRTWTQTFQQTPPEEEEEPAALQPLPFDWGTPDGPQYLLPPWNSTAPLTLTLASMVRPFKQTEWPLPRFEPRFGSWTQNLLQSTLSAPAAEVDTTHLILPFDWGTPDGPEYPASLRSWFGVKVPVVAVVAAPFNQEDWPTPRGYEYALPLRTWTLNLQQGTLRPFPIGEQVYARPELTAAQLLRSWAWTYNLNLIGQDLLPPGKDLFDLPVPRDYPLQLRTWTGVKVPLVVVALPFNQTDWQLPRAPLLPQRSWTWSYNLNLIGQDRLPAGEQIYDAPVGPIQPLRVWQWSYNLNLIGQDRLPVGDELFDLTPFGYIHPTQLRSWIAFVNLALVTPPAPRPFSQIDWPLPRAPQQPALSYTWSYNLNLVGQDRLPTGEQVFELTPRDYSRPHIYLWDWRYNLNLIGQDRLPVGEQRIELTPAGHIHPTQLRTWIDYRNLALDFVAGAQPDGKRWFDLAPRDDRPYQLRSWTWTYNLNLIGKDQLPVGNRISDLPPRVTPAAIQTWISQVNLALSRPAAPFSQTDWQNPRWPQQAVTNRTWTAGYNLNLIGKDRLPTGEAVFDLAPRGHIYPPDLRTFVRQLNLALIVPPAPLPKNQKDWPLPGAPHYPISIRSFINFSNIAFIVPPPPEVPPRDPTHVRTRGGFETDSRGPASLDRRGSDRFYRGRNQS
jgi:hypothetical protein